jgi:hypothetical protein
MQWREDFRDAVTFWEGRRLAYNLILTAVSVVWFGLDWQHFRPAMNLQLALVLVILALLANLCYCSAYLIDIPLQSSSLQDAWRRYRWCLWLAGVILGAVLASYWINDEIYPGVI